MWSVLQGSQRGHYPDHWLSKLKIAAVWANQLVEGRSLTPSRGKCKVQVQFCIPCGQFSFLSKGHLEDPGTSLWPQVPGKVESPECWWLELLEGCAQVQWQLGDSLVLAGKALGCASPVLGVPELCTVLQNAKIPQIPTGAAASALPWVQGQPSCSCVTESRTGNVLTWPYFAVHVSLIPWALCAILALHPQHNLIAFAIDFVGWFSFRLVLGYNRKKICFKIPFWNIRPFLKRIFFKCAVWLHVFWR